MMGHSTIQSFQAHIAVALQLLALVAGLFLLNKASRDEFFCKKTGQIVGGFVAVVSLLSLLCIGYLSIKQCCHKGYPMDSMDKMMKGTNWQHPPIDRLPTLPTDKQ